MSKININKANDISAIRPSDRNLPRSEETTAKNPEVKTRSSKDQVSFSNNAAEIGKLVDQIKSLPDERKGLVHHFRSEISSDQYNPSSVDIADAIISDEE